MSPTLLPAWVCGALAVSSFAAGFGSAIALGALLWWRNHTTGSLNPFQRGGHVLPPPITEEERASSMDVRQALEEGTREIMATAKSMGRPISYEEARSSARLALAEVLPEAAIPD